MVTLPPITKATEEQIRTAKRHFPEGYSRELPRLQNGHSAGLPRVYDIALETISHGDGRVDPESLSSFLKAYQTVTSLKLGELWAIPIMLRLALIENRSKLIEKGNSNEPSLRRSGNTGNGNSQGDDRPTLKRRSTD